MCSLFAIYLTRERLCNDRFHELSFRNFVMLKGKFIIPPVAFRSHIPMDLAGLIMMNGSPGPLRAVSSWLRAVARCLSGSRMVAATKFALLSANGTTQSPWHHATERLAAITVSPGEGTTVDGHRVGQRTSSLSQQGPQPTGTRDAVSGIKRQLVDVYD